RGRRRCLRQHANETGDWLRDCPLVSFPPGDRVGRDSESLGELRLRDAEPFAEVEQFPAVHWRYFDLYLWYSQEPTAPRHRALEPKHERIGHPPELRAEHHAESARKRRPWESRAGPRHRPP